MKKRVHVGFGARSMLTDFGMSADVVVRTDSSSGLAIGSRRGLGRHRHVQTWHVGAAASARRRPSLEEGAGRHERERRADETSRREAQDEPVDDDGLRVQRMAHIVGARSAVTNWRLKSSVSLRRFDDTFSKIRCVQG